MEMRYYKIGLVRFSYLLSPHQAKRPFNGLLGSRYVPKVLSEMPGCPYNNVNWKIVPTRDRMVKGIERFNTIFLFYIFLTLFAELDSLSQGQFF